MGAGDRVLLGVDAESVRVSFGNGVPEIHPPKTKETKGKKIERILANLLQQRGS